jgi:Cu+-exporting ATPase
MAMSSVSVVTNALRLRRFRLPERAALLRRLPWRDLLREYAYLGGIALASLTIGILALLYAAH